MVNLAKQLIRFYSTRRAYEVLVVKFEQIQYAVLTSKFVLYTWIEYTHVVHLVILLSTLNKFASVFGACSSLFTLNLFCLLFIWFQFRLVRSSRRRCSVKKIFSEISQNSQESSCARVSFLIKEETLAQVFRPATLFKKRPWHRCFPVNFVKFLRTPFC